MFLGQHVLAVDQDRQSEGQRLADRERTGLADEDVGDRHVAVHLAGVAPDHRGERQARPLDRPGQRLIAAAQEDHLDVGRIVAQGLRQLQHARAAVAAIHHADHRPIRRQPERGTRARQVVRHRLQEHRPGQQAVHAEQAVLGMRLARHLALADIGAGDGKIVLAPGEPDRRQHLHPVGHQHGEGRRAVAVTGQTVEHQVVDHRQDGDHEIRPGPLPQGAERLARPPAAGHHVDQRAEIEGEAEHPRASLLQDQLVVGLLHVARRVPGEQVEMRQHLPVGVDHRHPIVAGLLQDVLQRLARGPVAAAGIGVDDHDMQRPRRQRLHR